MIKLADDDKELAQEILGAPGWRVVVNQIIREKIEVYAQNLYAAARKNDGVACTVAVAKRDAVFDLLEAIYRAAGYEIPENIKTLKRGE